MLVLHIRTILLLRKMKKKAITKLFKELDIDDKYHTIYKYSYNDMKYKCLVCNELMDCYSREDHYKSHDQESIIENISQHVDHLFYDFKLIN
jgi:hypothetical protein